MDGEISFEALRRVQMAEKKNPSLTPLEEDFYSAYFDHLVNFETRLQADFTLESAKAYESTKKVLQDTAKIRQKKIIFKALTDFEGNGVDTTGMASEEKELYNSLITILSTYKPSLSTKQIQTQVKTISTVEAKTNNKKIKLLTDIPEFVGERGTLGPFSAGSSIELNLNDAKILIIQGVAQEI